MEVVPTSDGEDDDGVIWFRCPQCQGFLPKLSGADLNPDSADESATEESTSGDDKADSPDPPDPSGDSAAGEASATDDPMLWDSPADMMAAQQETTVDKKR